MRKLLGLIALVTLATVSQAEWRFFSQRDPAWSGQKLGNSNYSVYGYGCAMTSTAMVLAAGGANVNPGMLNLWLGANGGYTNGSIYWSVAARYDGAQGVTWVGTHSLSSPQQVKAWMDQGYGVVSYSKRFSSGHWVALRNYSGGGTSWSDFQYLDPWDLNVTTGTRRMGDGWVKAGNPVRLFKLPANNGGGGGNSQLYISESSEVAEGQVGFHRYGPNSWWSQSSAFGEAGHMYYTKNNDVAHGISNMADWRPLIGQTRAYEVYVFIPRNFGTTTCARYEIYHAGGRTDVQLNQMAYSDQWVSLGRFTFNQGQGGFLRLIDMTSETYLRKYIAFDAAKWEPR